MRALAQEPGHSASNLFVVAAFIRAAKLSDIDSIAHIHVASWHAAYRGIIPDEQIDARTIERRRSQWASNLQGANRITLIAHDGQGTVQGFASALLLDGSDGGFGSYLEMLYLLPEAQRRGIGGQLLHALWTKIRAIGVNNMSLRTLRLGAARAFYEHVGARIVPEGIATGAGHFDDVVYAFDDLGDLAERLM
jgi:GNAT superfamily N-acetyltransferase